MIAAQPDSATIDLAGGGSHCLYFLVSAASSGPLAGLVKVGIAESLPARHGQHRKVWGDFDLARSAVLRGVSRREARHLEMAVRYVFGNVDAEHAARQAGKTLSNDDYVAMKSWRRHPGRYDEGHTEFYGAECLSEMLDLIKFWLRCRGERAGKARLQPGLTAADCALRPNADGSMSTPLSKEGRQKQRAQEKARWQQVQAELNAHVASKARRLLDLALAYEEHLVYVDLTRWHEVRSWEKEGMVGGITDGVADLYFGFGRKTSANDVAQRPAALVRLEEDFRQIEMPVTSWPDNCHQRRRMEYERRERQVGFWHAPPNHRSWHPQPTFCKQAWCLRLNPQEYGPLLPFYDEFAVLAARVESRHHWEQLEL